MSEIKIPFSGFYESIWSGELDNCLEREAERLMEEYEGFEESEMREILSDCTDWAKAHHEVAEAYVDAFNDYIASEYSLQLGLKYKAMESPKEYNFTTDRLFSDIDFQSIRALCKEVGVEAIRKKAKEEFTSRSGFISFYSTDITRWGGRREWDHNQLGCVLDALVERDQDWKWGIFYAMQEEIGNIYMDCVDWKKVTEKIEEEIILEELGPDDRFYPRFETNPAIYIQKFVEGNGYKL